MSSYKESTEKLVEEKKADLLEKYLKIDATGIRILKARGKLDAASESEFETPAEKEEFLKVCKKELAELEAEDRRQREEFNYVSGRLDFYKQRLADLNKKEEKVIDGSVAH